MGYLPLSDLEEEQTYLLYSMPISLDGKGSDSSQLLENNVIYLNSDIKIIDKDTQDVRYWFKDVNSDKRFKLYYTLYGITWYLRSET